MDKKDTMTEGGKRLQQIKSLKKMTWQDIADTIGVKEATLRQISCGRLPLSKKMARRICDFFPEFNEAWLFKGEGEMYKEGYVDKYDPTNPYGGWTTKQLIKMIGEKDRIIENLEKALEAKEEVLQVLREQVDMLRGNAPTTEVITAQKPLL